MGKTNGAIPFLILSLFLAASFAAAFLPAQLTVLHEFSGETADGGGPVGNLIKVGSVLYGMTPFGGAKNEGTIFKINANGKGYAVLHSFDRSLPTDGANPFGSLVFKGGKLYGLTQGGGAFDCGVIFRINTNGSGFAVLHTFSGGAADGALPFGSLTFSGGQFYGMTLRGGTADDGTIFRLSPKGTGFAVLHSFDRSGNDVFTPQGSLRAAGKKLYGMAGWGGTDGFGAIFQINTNGSGYGLLYSFTGSETDGGFPFEGSLIVRGKILYGMTGYGGAGGNGVVFQIGTDGTGFALLHSFGLDETEGRNPRGSLVISGTQLFGLTEYGGLGDYGTIFQIGLDGTGYSVRHAFDSSAGAYPKGDLLLNGKMVYGMTDSGGASDWGVVFSYKIK